MVVKIGMKFGAEALAKVGQAIGKNAIPAVKKFGKGVSFAFIPESSVAKWADDAAKMAIKNGDDTLKWSADTVDLANQSAQVAEAAWWAPALARGGSAVGDGLKLKDVYTGVDKKETESENKLQIGLNLTSATMLIASMAVGNDAAKVALRVGGLAAGTSRDVHNTAMASSRGDSTWFDNYSWMGEFGSIYTDQYGYRQSGFKPLLDHHHQEDIANGLDYGTSSVWELETPEARAIRLRKENGGQINQTT